MASHQEASATDSAQSNKRKSTSTAELDAPNKRPNIDLEGGRLTGGPLTVRPDISDDAKLHAEIRELENMVRNSSILDPSIETNRMPSQLDVKQMPRKSAQTLKLGIAGYEQLNQVFATANPRSMHEDIAETMRNPDWKVFWEILIAGVVIKRRMVRDVVLTPKFMLILSRFLSVSCLSC
jgi:hypothetical protein